MPKWVTRVELQANNEQRPASLTVRTSHLRLLSRTYYLQRTRLELVAERKLRRRQLTKGGNVEITGRDLREGKTPERQNRG